jgi:hypothetical protein
LYFTVNARLSARVKSTTGLAGCAKSNQGQNKISDITKGICINVAG